MNQFAIYATPGGSLIGDYSHKVQGLKMATGPRGFAEASGFIPMSLAEAFLLYDRSGLLHCVFSDNTAGSIYEGRLEDVRIVTEGIDVRVFGYARAFSDIPYTALWSITTLDDYTEHWTYWSGSNWDPVNARPYTLDVTDTAINIGLIKNTFYSTWRGELRYQVPDQSSRNIVGLSLDYEFLASSNITLRITRYNTTAAFPFYSFGADIASATGSGVLQRGNAFFSFTGSPIIAVGLEANTAHTYTGETGAEYARITNVRLVTDTSNQINTTLTVARTNGTPVTITVGSTANMYVGQRLLFQSGGNNESPVVLSIPSATTFTANIQFAPVGGWPIGTNVFAWLIYADPIAKDLLTATRAVNSNQLNSSTAFIGSPGIDLLNEIYEDRSMEDILDYLIGLGDTQSPPRKWEWGVADGQLLYFRPQSSAGRTWYIDLADIDIDRTLDQLRNSAYARYADVSGRTLRTATAADSTSVARYGLTRRQAVSTQTTISIWNTTVSPVAEVQRDAALNDTKDPPPRSSISLSRVYDATGARWPLAYVRAGDTITTRNLPPTLSTTIDRIRSFRLTRAEYHADDDTLNVEPDVPRPTLDVLLARLAIGLKP